MHGRTWNWDSVGEAVRQASFTALSYLTDIRALYTGRSRSRSTVHSLTTSTTQIRPVNDPSVALASTSGINATQTSYPILPSTFDHSRDAPGTISANGTLVSSFGHTAIMDTLSSVGGEDLWFSPAEALYDDLSSLLDAAPWDYAERLSFTVRTVLVRLNSVLMHSPYALSSYRRDMLLSLSARWETHIREEEQVTQPSLLRNGSSGT